MITEFRGEYAFLSNFFPSPVESDGILYPTLEHFFQAHKVVEPRHREMIAGAQTPGDAKVMGRGVTLRPDWEGVKLGVMRAGLALKFTYGSWLGSNLVATTPQGLVEGNTWGDNFWGATEVNGEWSGRNWLGWLLMAQRAYLLTEDDD